jgi:hypothetical protein
MIFTISEPTFKLADSNEIAVIVQKNAVQSANNSPRWFVRNGINLFGLFILIKGFRTFCKTHSVTAEYCYFVSGTVSILLIAQPGY